MQEIKEILEGNRCEKCSEERVFGSPPDASPENLYVYIDLSGATRCFCKKHMSFCDGDGAIAKEGVSFTINSPNVIPCFGATLISELLEEFDKLTGETK